MRSYVIDRPASGNALDRTIIAGLVAALEGAEADRRPLLITASGNRHFCAGFDLTMVEQGPLSAATSLLALLDRINRRSVPMMCVVNGAARGAGVMLAVMCDVVITMPQATFGMPEIKLGIPSFAGLELLSLRMSPMSAASLVVGGFAIDADAAHRSGIVDLIAGTDALAMAENLAAASWTDANLPAYVALRRVVAQREAEALQRAREHTMAWLAA